MNGIQKWNSFQKIAAKKMKITWHGKSAHADDEEIKLESETELRIEVNVGVLQFLTK